MNPQLILILLLLGGASITLPGCVYRQDIPQGNRIDAAQIQRLELGMSQSQVQFLLGSPAVVDLYQPNQWHYIYFLKTGDDGKIEQRQMTLKFADGVLSEIDGSLSPG